MRLPAVDVRDTLAFGGAGLMGAGGWLVDPSLGLMIAGACLFYLGALHPLIARR